MGKIAASDTDWWIIYNGYKFQKLRFNPNIEWSQFLESDASGCDEELLRCK